ncbi:DUF4129 domain-containing protein [Henriciella marina]|uniref:DUF4129 domain-containing protein n=1 Tax=Henriciella marina TaxID=453851 RepID=UPI00036A9A54|nr:DUF4129 domain-containing protein [Henriciella marina]
MKSVLLCAALAILLLFGPLPGGDAYAQENGDTDAASVETLVERHAANDRIQTERPSFQPEPREERRRSENGLLEAIGKFFAWLIQNFGWLFRILIIAAIVAVIGYALWYMLGGLTLPARRKKQDKAAADVSYIDGGQPERRQATALLEEADALAAQGRFAEAVHLLLFRSIADLNARRVGGVPQSLTAREIAALNDLPEKARSALSPIIRLVEKSFFGERPVDQSGWKEARASYEAFAFRGSPA